MDALLPSTTYGETASMNKNAVLTTADEEKPITSKKRRRFVAWIELPYAAVEHGAVFTSSLRNFYFIIRNLNYILMDYLYIEEMVKLLCSSKDNYLIMKEKNICTDNCKLEAHHLLGFTRKAVRDADLRWLLLSPFLQDKRITISDIEVKEYLIMFWGLVKSKLSANMIQDIMRNSAQCLAIESNNYKQPNFFEHMFFAAMEACSEVKIYRQKFESIEYQRIRPRQFARLNRDVEDIMRSKVRVFLLSSPKQIGLFK